MAITINEIPTPEPSPSYSDITTSGPKLSPQLYIQTYSDKEWERFIEECVQSLKRDYVSVNRLGGAGDQGVDIAAFKTAYGFDGAWDNYQCKHYDHALYPSDIWLELGKLCYYTFKKEYTIPENYFILAPRGIGTSLSKLLKGKPEDLKAELLKVWGKECQDNITKTEKVLLTGDFLKHVETFDFSIVKDVPILSVLEIHRKTPYYHTRFGGGLPTRPAADLPPEKIADNEAVYIKKLLSAYAEFLNTESCSIEDLASHSKLEKHLKSARIQFYSAESLNKFSRDYLEAGEYDRLQGYIYAGIENIILAEHKNGFERVVSAIQEAYKIQIDSHPLKDRMEVLDRAGICHQLANNNTLTWANHEQE